MDRRFVSLAVLAAFVVLVPGCAKVLNDEGGVVTRYLVARGIKEEPLGPGLYLSIPHIQEVATYPVYESKYEMTKEAMQGDTRGRDDVQLKSRDGQIVWVDVTIRFRLVFEKLPVLHRQYHHNYVETAIRPMARALTAYKFGALSAEEIYEGTVREQIGLEIRAMMNDGYENVSGLRERGIEILDVLFRSFEFTDEYQTAIEQKRLAAEQRLAAIELAKKREAEAEGEKLATIKIAEGQAEAARQKADGALYAKMKEAEGVQAIGLAEATAKEALAKAMGGGEQLVALEFARNLSDKLQIFGVPTGAQSSSFLDLSGLFGGMYPKTTSPAPAAAPVTPPAAQAPAAIPAPLPSMGTAPDASPEYAR